MAVEDRHEEVFTDEECIDCTERERSFDALSRGLANGSISRGKALRMLGAALAGSVLASIPGVALAKPPPGKCKPQGAKCIVNRDCCSQNCFTQKGKMICGPVSGACFSNGDCTSLPGQDQCTKAVCNPAGVCVLEPIAGCCLDVNACPQGNACQNPVCVSNVCELEEIADCCLDATQCNDNNVCTTDTCVGNVCMHTPTNQGGRCAGMPTNPRRCCNGVCCRNAGACTALGTCP